MTYSVIPGFPAILFASQHITSVSYSFLAFSFALLEGSANIIVGDINHASTLRLTLFDLADHQRQLHFR